MPASELEAFKRHYAVRTAPRLSLFARRYHGPGEDYFASGNYLAGAEALNTYFASKKTAKVDLQGAQWNE